MLPSIREIVGHMNGGTGLYIRTGLITRAVDDWCIVIPHVQMQLAAEETSHSVTREFITWARFGSAQV